MTRYIVIRLLQLVPVVVGIIVIGFLLIHLAPGDPVLVLAGEHGDAQYYAFMRHRFGLDRPLLGQIATYFLSVLRGDFSYSYVYGRDALTVIAERAPATLLLTGGALLLATVVAIPLGAIAAQHAGRAADSVIAVLTLTTFSAPVFWIAQLGVLLFAVTLRIAPVQGMTTASMHLTGLSYVADVARHLALPLVALALQELPVLVRLTRNGLLEELARAHVRTARAKGIPERSVVYRHAMPRALMPALTVIGMRAGHLVAGAVLVETVFGWPGVGRLLYTALQTRDTPVLLGLFFVVAFSVLLFNLITDVVHVAADPRISLSGDAR